MHASDVPAMNTQVAHVFSTLLFTRFKLVNTKQSAKTRLRQMIFAAPADQSLHCPLSSVCTRRDSPVGSSCHCAHPGASGSLYCRAQRFHCPVCPMPYASPQIFVCKDVCPVLKCGCVPMITLQCCSVLSMTAGVQCVPKPQPSQAELLNSHQIPLIAWAGDSPGQVLWQIPHVPTVSTFFLNEWTPMVTLPYLPNVGIVRT